MPKATCMACGRQVAWQILCGSRLAFVRCPDCGGELRVIRVERPPSRGPKVRCVVCGRVRRDDGVGIVRPGYTFRVAYALPGEAPGPHPPRSPVCWHHTLERLQGESPAITRNEVKARA